MAKNFREFVNARGETVRVYETDRPFVYRVEVNGKAYNPVARMAA